MQFLQKCYSPRALKKVMCEHEYRIITRFFKCALQAILLKVLIGNSEQTHNTSSRRLPCCKDQVHLRNIMSIKNNFRASSTSLRLMPDESDGYEKIVRESVTSRHKHPRTNRTDLGMLT